MHLAEQSLLQIVTEILLKKTKKSAQDKAELSVIYPPISIPVYERASQRDACVETLTSKKSSLALANRNF